MKTWLLTARTAPAAGVCLLLVLCASGCNNRAAAGPRADVARGDDLRKTLVTAAAPAEASAASGDAAAEGSGWATLSGTFKLVNSAPQPTRIDANKDPEVCGKHPLFDESLQAGPNGGLENAVIWVRTAKLPVNPEAVSKAEEVLLDNKDCRFEPHVVSLTTHQKLLLKNSDPIGHNSKGDPLVNSPFNVLIPSGQSVAVDLAKEESLPIKIGCSIHPWMGGWIVLRSDPYAAVSDKDGNFTLKDLPAGRELEFQLWQERAGFLKEAEADGVKIDAKGRFRLKLAAGEDKKLEFKVNLK